MGAKIEESRKARKDLDKAPEEVLRSYEVWARLIEEHGASILRLFKGYHDEKLAGQWEGFRSSRLNRKWRVIYSLTTDGFLEVVTVERVSAHDYRKR